MFKRKQDVDKHVLSVLNRKKDEKERNAQGYQIARLYLDIKEYETAKKYLANFLHVRENYPQAYQMMGEINEALGKKELAVENYKRALDLGGFGSSNRQLVLKICELYCDLGTDVQRMKYWLQKCEELFPQSDIVYRMKSQLASTSSNGHGNNSEMEKLILDELLNRPTDVGLRVKLLQLYLDMGRLEEAYDTAVETDLTMAFVEDLAWYECVMDVFQKYSQSNPDSVGDTDFMLLNMHVLRNISLLSLPNKNIHSSVALMKKLDHALKQADSAGVQEESWVALLKEMKGQLLFLAGLVLVKRAMMGSIPWQEANHLSGACFLASRNVSPLDAQAPWFVKPEKGFAKFYNWWHLQSYDRLSQVGRMIEQLSQNDMADWSRTVHQQTMTVAGHRRVFEAVYARGNESSQEDHADDSFFYGTDLMVGQMQEPLSSRQLLDIDKVAYQVHLGKLSHLVWLCLHRYSPNMDSQPNYHFSLMENIQFSVKNMETAGSENLCQLDVLAFLLASVRCAASSISENVFSYEDQSGRPTLLPACLSRPLCTQEQEEWWTSAFKFCSNSAKDNFSRLRRVLIRGVEVIRLKGSHGMSIQMQCHLARSLDAKAKSLRDSEFGCRCSAGELASLEARALFYWNQAYVALQKVKKNQHPPIVKNRLFKEAGDGDLPPRLVDTLLADAEFATAVSLMQKSQYEDALERFERHRSPWAAFYSAQIHKEQAYLCQNAGKDEAYKSEMRKSRDLLNKTLDRLIGDKTHDLNSLVSNEMEALEMEIQRFDFDENESSSARETFYTPSKSPSNNTTYQGEDSYRFSHSTPRPKANGVSRLETSDISPSPSQSRMSQPSYVSHASPHMMQEPRPSPERLDSQIKSLGYSQSTLFKMVLDRNEELVLMHSRMMEEHRNHNNTLQDALTENKKVMEALKDMLVENRDMLKGIKSELANLKPGVLATPPPPPPPSAIPQGPPLLVAPHLPPTPRGVYPGFPHPSQPAPGLPQYPGYLLNSPIHQPPPPHAATAGPNFRPSGLPGARSSQVGKFKPQLGVVGVEGGEEEEEEEEDLDPTAEEISAMYPEYFADDYSQYYTPESHLTEWSLRSAAIESNQSALSMTPGIQQSATRMPMPQPGFFASALRGQSLQFAQQATPVSPAAVQQPQPIPVQQPQPIPVVSSKLPANIGPGFFSTPMSSATFSLPAVVPPPEGVNAVAPSLQGNIPIFSAMSSIGSGSQSMSPSVVSSDQVGGVTSGQPTRPAVTSAGVSPEDLEATLGFKILFHIKASLPAKNAKGAVTILMGPNNSMTTVFMMSDAEEMLFQHNANGLVVHPTPIGAVGVTWTASKIGSSAAPSMDKETVTVVTMPESMGNLLKDALIKAAISIKMETGGTPASAAAPLKPAAPDVAKTVFGGFSFSSSPVVTPAHTEREIAHPHKAATSPVKITDAPKPFAGVSLSVPKAAPAAASPEKGFLGQTQSSPQKSPGKGDGEEYEPNVDFKPLIPLPELVDKKTGEENETAVFVDRCRLYRFDPATSQWKERGVGELKILGDNNDHRFRVVMRRDQILKLCANHFISDTMKLSTMPNSEKTLCYSAMDYSDEEMKVEQLAVRFKNQDKAQTFKEAFEGCVAKLAKDAADEAKADLKTPSPGKNVKGFVADSTTTSVPPTSKPAFSFFSQPSGSTTSTPPTTAAPPSAATSTSAAAPASTTTTPLSELFKPKQGSWECDGCMCQNQGDQIKCPACGNAKPGSKQPEATTMPAASFATGGALFKVGGFSFGSSAPSSSSTPATTTTPTFGGVAAKTTAATTTPATSSKSSSAPAKPASTTITDKAPAAAGGDKSLSELFKPKAGSWECDGCMCRNQEDQLKCPACGQLKPGVKKEDLAPAGSISSTGGFSFGGSGGSTGGFSFGSGSGFSFGAPASSSSSSSNSSTTSAPTATSATAATSSTPAAKPGAFSFPAGGFNFGTTPTKAAPQPVPPATPVKSKEESSTKPPAPAAGSGSLLASLLTSDESKAEPKDKSGGFNFAMTPGQKPASTASNSSGFNFNFQKSPTMAFSTPAAAKSPAKVPNSPEVDEHGLYVTKEGEDSHIHFEPVIKLPDKVEVKSGEEEEEVLFESRARMYRFTSGEWKEKGVGVMKILQHKQTRKARVLMRRDQVLKICCNHVITSDLELKPMPKMEGKAWLWFAMDFSEEEGKLEQLAVRFKKPETAEEFKDVFNRCKGTPSAENTPQKSAQPQAAATESDDDVIFVKEEKSPGFSFKPPVSMPTTADDDAVVFVKEEEATPEQKALAAKYQLPENFYLYETRKPCRGCIGCTDGEGLPPFAVSPKPKKEPELRPPTMSYAQAAKSPSKPLSPSIQTTPTAPKDKTHTTFTAPVAKSIFGSSATPDSTPVVKSIFGSASTPDTTSKSIFGSASTTDTTSKSIFGSAAAAPSKTTPEQSPTTAGKSIFGSGSSEKPSIFGSPGSTGKPSIFGSPATLGTPPSIFGGGGAVTSTTPDFSSLLKGGSTAATTTSSSPATSATAPTSTASPFSNFVFGAGSSTPDFSSLAATSDNKTSFLKKDEAGGPFKFHGAGQKLFGGGGGGDTAGGGDGEGDVAPSSDPHFEPIIPLPDLVEVKTGEEDWSVVFSHRAKLYKFDRPTKQWKERGVGELKILSYNKEMVFRILQRREQVLKVACNHLITKDMSLNSMFNSETAWCWVANDLTDIEGGPSVEQFAVKFKNKDVAAKFRSTFEECQQKLKEKETVTSTTSEPTGENKQEEEEEGEEYDDDDEYEDVDDDDDEIIFEKRATLNCLEDGKLKTLGLGQLCVKYNEDLNGNAINFTADDDTKLCSHIVCREHDIALDAKHKSCEWKPLDYATDEPIRRHFRVSFSSAVAAEEFAKVFMEGKRLAIDSDLSEKLPTDIDVPEVFSRGEQKQ